MALIQKCKWLEQIEYNKRILFLAFKFPLESQDFNTFLNLIVVENTDTQKNNETPLKSSFTRSNVHYNLDSDLQKHCSPMI